ncbi:MAG TPA: glycosyltransferase family 2 protein [Bacteroidia bacterium]|nr:glycosyltransferase family 2 protein [Bacteroidia bacterium]
MEQNKSIREFLFQARKRAKARLALAGRRFLRLLHPVSLSASEAFSIPIIINNRNRYTYLKSLVEWLKQAGYQNIIVLDNDSTYPPLLEYYTNCPARVIRLGKNLGYKALWDSRIFGEFRKSYYVYSDPDLLPVENCPKDLVYQLLLVLEKYRSIEKCGPALKIDDLPDHYAHKEEVIHGVEGRYWKKEVEKNIFDAPLDTTFALYKPYAYGSAESCKAFRLGGAYCFRHLPWYENSNQAKEEDVYYASHASTSSSWYNKEKKNATP